jgi:hypothetical protein
MPRYNCDRERAGRSIEYCCVCVYVLVLLFVHRELCSVQAAKEATDAKAAADAKVNCDCAHAGIIAVLCMS